jgi:hypothetical protein
MHIVSYINICITHLFPSPLAYLLQDSIIKKLIENEVRTKGIGNDKVRKLLLISEVCNIFCTQCNNLCAKEVQMFCYWPFVRPNSAT